MKKQKTANELKKLIQEYEKLIKWVELKNAKQALND